MKKSYHKVSNKLKYVILPAREEGWELWALKKGQLHLEQHFKDLASQPLPRDAVVAMPTKAVATIPIIIPVAEYSSQRDIAHLQMEQCGLLKSNNNSWDIFPIDHKSSLNTGVSLINDSIANDSNLQYQAFDLAARYYEVGDIDIILCKREQGKWILIFYKEASPFYAEVIDSLESISSIIKPLLIQFSIQGIDFDVDKILIDKGDISINEQSICSEVIEHSLNIKTKLVDYISPVIHRGEALKLIPNKVSLARKREKFNAKLKFYSVIGLCIYALGCIFLIRQYKEQNNQMQLAHNRIFELQPKWAEYQVDLLKLNELENVLTNNWPLASFEKIVSHIPGNQEIRFQTVEINTEYFLIKGVSPNINLINELYPALARDPYFEDYTWRVPVKAENQKTKLWNFTLEAIKKGT